MTNAATKAATHVARVPESGCSLSLRLELGQGNSFSGKVENMAEQLC
jgi:hypothetical protein